ncbi:MAG: ATP-binding cassette domain-containing protein [Pseudomonadota bacterium]
MHKKINNPLITANHINVIKQGKHILKNVSLTIGVNDFITIIGPNGAGKSMLLKCLMQLYRPDSGTITHKKHIKIGYVPQRLIADQTMPITVQRFLSLKKASNPVKLKKTLQETGIDHILKQPLFVLSGGELQRVLLARSLLDNPELLVLDEPAQNLDISGQLGFYKLLEQIYNKHQLSILMVSHDLHMVMASSKKVICLFHHICCSGAPHVVTKDPEFISLFGHDMAKMMSVYQHHHDHHHDPMRDV